MVTNALSHYLKESHPSRLGIGHVRYSTHGTNKLENAQPIVVSCSKGEISLAHNGNISNSEELQKRLVEEGSIFQSTSDTELLLHLIARSRAAELPRSAHRVPRAHRGRVLLPHDAREQALRGARSLGFRPLVVGTRAGAGACGLGDVRPGHVPGARHPRGRAGRDAHRRGHADHHGKAGQTCRAAYAQARGRERTASSSSSTLRGPTPRSSTARCT